MCWELLPLKEVLPCTVGLTRPWLACYFLSRISWASEENPHILWSPDVQYCVHRSLPTACVISQINPAHSVLYNMLNNKDNFCQHSKLTKTTFIHFIGMCRMRHFLAILRSFLHSSLLCTFSCHPSPTILPSSLTLSSHLFLGLPLSLIVPIFIYNTLLGILFSSILCTCQNQRNIFSLTVSITKTVYTFIKRECFLTNVLTKIVYYLVFETQQGLFPKYVTWMIDWSFNTSNSESLFLWESVLYLMNVGWLQFILRHVYKIVKSDC